MIYGIPEFMIFMVCFIGALFIPLVSQIAGEKAPQHMEDVLSTLSKNITSITTFLDKLNKPFAYLANFNDKIIPQLIRTSVREGGKKGQLVVKGITITVEAFWIRKSC